MIWKTKTHQFTATVCQRTGKTCPALARMARTLTQAVAQAGPVTTDKFEIEGSSELSFCPGGCTARFRARPDQIRVFCGREAEDDLEALDRYADMIFGTGLDTLPSSAITSPPCAMLEVTAIASREVPAQVHQVSP